MKKLFLALFFVIFCLHANAQTVTSVADGNWTNPLTWGGMPPIPGNTVIINHDVILDTNFAYTSGSITVQSGASLTGNTGLRGLTLNYPSGTGFLTVLGSFDVARVSFFADTVSVGGSFNSDSLYNQSVILISSAGSIHASQFFNGIGGRITNAGEIVSTNLLNLETIVNLGVIQSSDFNNCKSLFNNSGAVIALNHDFLNADSITGPAIFTNNGRQEVMNDWQNQDTVYGTGRFCIVNNTNNSGLMSGSFDFCDLTGGNIDMNTGSIDTTITYCAFPCTPGTNEYVAAPLIKISPNPGDGIFNIDSETEISSVEVMNLLGEIVYSQQVDATRFRINLQSCHNGIYFYRLSSKNKIIETGKIIIER